MLIDDLPFEHGDFPKPAPSSVIKHGWEIPEPNGRDDFLSNVTDYQRLTHHLDPFGASTGKICVLTAPFSSQGYGAVSQDLPRNRGLFWVWTLS